MAKEKEEVLLVDNDFWNDNEDFFGIESGKKEVESKKEITLDDDDDLPPVTSKEKTPAAKAEPAKKAEKKEEVKEEEVVEEPFFEITDTKKEEPGKPASEVKASTVETNDVQTDAEFFKTLTKSLQEKGILQNVEITEEELDEDAFIELHDKEIEARVSETIETFFEDLDEDAIAFLKFKKSNGNTRDFLNAYSSSMELPAYDTSTKEGAEAVLRYYYKKIEGLDEDDVESRIEWANENLKTTKFAEKYNTILQQKEQQKRDQVLLQTEQKLAEAEEDRLTFQKEVTKTLSTLTEVKGIPITKEDKDLGTYATKNLVKVGKNRYITGLQADVQKIFQNPDRSDLILFAKIVKSGLTLVKAEAKKKDEAKKTEVVKEIKENIFRQQRTQAAGGGGSKESGKSLSDFF